MIAKVAGGIIGLGLISTGGIAMAKPWWLGMDYMPEWHPISAGHGYSDSTYGAGKFGDTHKNYLVGVTHKKDGQNNETSESWWEWAYRRLQEDEVKEGAFKLNEKVKRGFKKKDSSATTPKSLSQVCEDAYKAEATSVKKDANNNEFNKEHVWKYCSPLGVAPKTIQENTGEENDYPVSGSQNSIGKTKASELLSIKHPDNQKLWELKNDEFFGRGVFKSATTPSDAFFKALFAEKDNNKDKDALKNKCAEAYKLTSETSSDDANKTSETEVLKYCSLKSIK